jgi:hypothetical protein
VFTGAFTSPAENGLTAKLDVRITAREKNRWREYAEAHLLSVLELIGEAVNARVASLTARHDTRGTAPWGSRFRGSNPLERARL